MQNKNLTKRLIWGTILGLITGILGFVGFSINPYVPTELAMYQTWGITNIIMWIIISDRLVLGVMVAIAGFITKLPIFNLKLPTYLRGAKIGGLIALPMAVGSLLITAPTAQYSFWLILIVGIIVGSIIDLIITKIAGEGKELM